MEKLGFNDKDFELYKDCFEGNLAERQIVSKDDVYQKHDKTFKGILKNSKEMSLFLSNFVGLEVKKENLEIYNCNFITKDYRKRESDIIYKEKNRYVYYIIEHQSKIDKNMPRRILEYCVELMREIMQSHNTLNNPLIIPIVIYTGESKWNVPVDFSNTQILDKNNKVYALKLKYKLIDVNRFSTRYLNLIDCKISKMLILEKCKNNVELSNFIKDFASNAKNKNDKIWINSLVEYIFAQSLDSEQKSEILRILYGKENDMEDLIERIKRNERIRDEKNVQKGIKRGIKVAIKNMLKYNMPEEDIMKYTNATSEEIQKVKKSLRT